MKFERNVLFIRPLNKNLQESVVVLGNSIESCSVHDLLQFSSISPSKDTRILDVVRFDIFRKLRVSQYIDDFAAFRLVHLTHLAS